MVKTLKSENGIIINLYNLVSSLLHNVIGWKLYKLKSK